MYFVLKMSRMENLHHLAESFLAELKRVENYHQAEVKCVQDHYEAELKHAEDQHQVELKCIQDQHQVELKCIQDNHQATVRAKNFLHLQLYKYEKEVEDLDIKNQELLKETKRGEKKIDELTIDFGAVSKALSEQEKLTISANKVSVFILNLKILI